MFKPQITTALTKKIDIPESEATVTIKHIKPGLMQAIVQGSMSVVSKQKDQGMVQEVGFNLVKRSRDIVMASITAWSGFSDAEKRPMKFSSLNVAKMIDESSEFVDFIVAEQEKLNVEYEAEQEAVEKN